jgi:hypothetical protein
MKRVADRAEHPVVHVAASPRSEDDGTAPIREVAA